MKLLFIFNDAPRCAMEYEYTNARPAISRRTAEIELTAEQKEKVKRAQVGLDCGRAVYESLESITFIDEGEVTS